MTATTASQDDSSHKPIRDASRVVAHEAAAHKRLLTFIMIDRHCRKSQCGNYVIAQVRNADGTRWTYEPRYLGDRKTKDEYVEPLAMDLHNQDDAFAICERHAAGLLVSNSTPATASSTEG